MPSLRYLTAYLFFQTSPRVSPAVFRLGKRRDGRLVGTVFLQISLSCFRERSGSSAGTAVLMENKCHRERLLRTPQDITSFRIGHPHVPAGILHGTASPDAFHELRDAGSEEAMPVRADRQFYMRFKPSFLFNGQSSLTESENDSIVPNRAEIRQVHRGTCSRLRLSSGRSAPGLAPFRPRPVDRRPVSRNNAAPRSAVSSRRALPGRCRRQVRSEARNRPRGDRRSGPSCRNSRPPCR